MPANRVVLLFILYLSFVSLGLPDTALGVAWPRMRHSFGAALDVAGMLTALVTICSVVSSLSTGWVLGRMCTGLLLAVCGFLTGGALLGYALAPALWLLVVCAVPQGLGQGAVDAAVNTYMARHYSARQMNWVHACWGLGATGGPFLLTLAFTAGYSWRAGYGVLAGVQLALSVLFVCTLPLWQHDAAPVSPADAPVPGTPPVPCRPDEHAGGMPRGGHRRLCVGAGVAAYFIYPGIETVAGLWGASYMVEVLGASVTTAGGTIALYWGALTLGRVGAGWLAGRYGAATLIRGGCILALAGAGLTAGADGPWGFLAGLALVGLGIGPFYPSLMHDTPRRLGPIGVERIIGVQVGASLAGATIIPLLVGAAAQRVSLELFCPVLAGFTALLLGLHECSLACAPRVQRPPAAARL